MLLPTRTTTDCLPPAVYVMLGPGTPFAFRSAGEAHSFWPVLASSASNSLGLVCPTKTRPVAVFITPLKQGRGHLVFHTSLFVVTSIAPSPPVAVYFFGPGPKFTPRLSWPGTILI